MQGRLELGHIHLEAGRCIEAHVHWRQQPRLGEHRLGPPQALDRGFHVAHQELDAGAGAERHHLPGVVVVRLAVDLDLFERARELSAFHPQQRLHGLYGRQGDLVAVLVHELLQLNETLLHAGVIAPVEAALPVDVEGGGRLPEPSVAQSLVEERLLHRVLLGPVTLEKVVDEVHQPEVEQEPLDVSRFHELPCDLERPTPDPEGDPAEREDSDGASEDGARLRDGPQVQLREHVERGQRVRDELGRGGGLRQAALEADVDDFPLDLAGGRAPPAAGHVEAPQHTQEVPRRARVHDQPAAGKPVAQMQQRPAEVLDGLGELSAVE